MGPLQTITYAWSGAMQSKSDRKLQQGELTEMVNYRRTLDGEWRKRLGNVKTVVDTFHGGTYQGPAAAMEACDAVLIRDDADQLFLVDDSNGAAYYRGTDLRATPRWFEIENRANAGGTTKPLQMLVGDDLVELALGAYDDQFSSAAYQITVLDPITRTVKRETEIMPAAGIVSYAATVDHNGQLWVGWVNGSDGVIKLHHYVTATGSPTIYTWATQAGATFIGIDIFGDPATGWLYVFALSAKNSAGDRVTGIYRSYGSTLMGTANTSGFDATTLAGGSGVWASSGPFVLEHDPADGFMYLAYTRNNTSLSTSAQVVLEKVSKLAPGTVVETVLGSYTIADGQALASASGYYDEDTGDRIVLVTFANLFGSDDSSFISKNNLLVDRFTYNGSFTVKTTVARSAWLASKPFQIDGEWFFLTGFDDGDNTGDYDDASNGVQNGFFVRNIDGTIIAPVMDGEGGFAFFGVPTIGGVHVGSPTSPHVIRPSVVGETLAAFSLLNIGLVRNRPGRTVALVNFDDTYYSDAPGVLPGTAKIVGPADTAIELTPIHGPYSPPTFPGGFGTGSVIATVYITFLYKVANSAGDAGPAFPWPVASTPYVFSGLVDDPFTIRLPSLRHQLGGAVEIEIYGSENNFSTPFVQGSVLNDPTADYVDLVIYPGRWTAKTEGEILYTQGGGLPNNAPEHARIVWQQGQRTMLGGTPSGNIWPSREKESGRLPEYNAASSFAWNQGSGELQAACEVDANTSALFKRDAIAVATGNPDGRGAGGYSVATVAGKWGCTEPGAVVRTKLGIIFPNSASGGRMAVLAGGAVTEIHQGMESYRGFTWKKAIDCPSERCVRWYATNGKRLVLDYSQMSAEDLTPKWILEEGEGLPAAVGAQLIGGVATMLEAGDATPSTWQPSAGIADEDFLDDGVEVLTDAVSGRMGLAGFMNEFDADWVTFSSTWRGGDSTFEYSMIPDTGVAEVHPDVPSEEADVAFRSACMRTRDLRTRVRETSATGEGRSFDGVALGIRSYGRTKVPARVIA